MQKALQCFILGFFAFLLSLLPIDKSWGQCQNITISGQDIGIVQPEMCAPVEIGINVSYTFAYPVDPNKVKIRIEWNDRDDNNSAVDEIPAIEETPGSRKYVVSRNMVYAPGPNCTYEPVTYLVYDGVRCTSTRQSQLFSAWSTDDFNPGTVTMDPVTAEYCPSTPINQVFRDNTTFNCNKDIEPDKPNRLSRWVQFIYNTNPSNGDLIQNAQVNGVQLTDINGNFLNEEAGDIEEIAAPADGPVHVSLPITAPSGSPTGSYIEVTMRNWNICNPYDDPNIPGPPSDPVNGDNPPIETTARVLIVDPPNPAFTIGRDDNPNSTPYDKFCPGETVYFRNATSSGNYDYSWKFTGPNGFSRTESRISVGRDYFRDAGEYTAELTVTDKNAAGSCEATVFRKFEIIDSPDPDMEVSLDGDVITDFDFCERIGGDFDFSIKNETTFPVGATVKYEWRLIQDGVDKKSVDTNDINELFEFTLSEPGAYKVTLTAIDDHTDCSNTKKIDINIYNAPKAIAAIVNSQDLCVGREVKFNDKSVFENSKAFADDAIVKWEWWFDYGNNPNSQSTAQNPTYAFAAIGEYEVKLEVTTQYGCTDDTVFTITVNPIAEAAITVDMDEGCAPFEPVFTNVKANGQDAGIAVLRYKWIGFNENNDIIFEEDQFPDPATNVFVDTFAYSFPYTRTDNQNQLYKVIMEAYSADENGDEGCVTTSDEITLTVFPAASARFFSNYDPYGSNCTPVVVDFEVDAATKALPFAKTYEWVVSDETGEVFNSGQSTTETFSYTFTSVDSIAIKNYNVTLTAYAASGPCIQPYTQQIKINPTPSSKFTYTVTGQCDNVDINFNANQKGLRPQDYHWTFMEQGTGSPAIPENDPVLNDNFTLTFARDPFADRVVEATLRTKNSFGCESTGPTQTFTIPKLEDFTVKLDAASDYPKCAPFIVAFDNTSAVPHGTMFSLKVQKGSGGATTIPSADIDGDLDGQFSYAFDEAGSYVVTLIASNPTDGCTSEDYINVTIHPAVEAVFDPSETVVCVDQQIELNEKSYAPALIKERKWTITEISDPANPVNVLEDNNLSRYSFDAPGKYEIKLTVQSDQGCSDVIAKEITVLPPPEFALDYNAISCDQSFTFEIKVTDPATTITNVDWVWGDGQTESTTVLDNAHLYFNRNGFNGPYEYTGKVTATATTGCKFTQTFTVKLLQDVSANFSMDKNKSCAPLSIVFDDLSLGHDPAEQIWSYREVLPTVGSWITFSGIDHTFMNNSTQTKTYEVRLQSKSVDGCTDEMTKEVTVEPQVIADFDIEYLADCSPMEVKFINNAVRSGVEYVWDWSDGTDEDTTTIALDIVHVFENASFSRPRNFKVSLTATDIASGCSSFLEKTVTVQPAMSAVLEPEALEGCSPMEVNILNTSNGISIHDWQVVNTTTNQVMVEYSGNNPNYTETLTNTTFDTIQYQIIYTGTTGSNACFVKDTIAVLVYPEITPSFLASPSVQHLPHATVTLDNKTPNNPYYTYEWDFGNGTFSTERDPDPIEYMTYGLYTISLKVADQYGQCVQEVAETVEIKPTIPEIDFEYHPAEGCGPLTVQFINKSKYIDEGTLLWDFGDNNTSRSREKNPTYTYYEPGRYTVTLQASNAVGIVEKETKEYIINVYDNPRANFRIRQGMPIYMPDSVIFRNESVGAVSYLWDFGDGTTSTEFAPTHAYAAPGDYTITLVATSALGCTDTLVRHGEVEIEAQFDVKIPNVFTPNGNKNNIFLPLMRGVVEYNLLIYNRWGELLFESKSQEVGWDGYYKGVMSPPGVYIYKLDLKFKNGERTSKLGDVTLLR